MRPIYILLLLCSLVACRAMEDEAEVPASPRTTETAGITTTDAGPAATTPFCEQFRPFATEILGAPLDLKADASNCIFEHTPIGISERQAIEILVERAPLILARDLDRMKAGTATPVPGIGEEAYYDPELGLYFRKGEIRGKVEITPGAIPDPNRRLSEKQRLARLVVDAI
jgi:hypothetical protein